MEERREEGDCLHATVAEEEVRQGERPSNWEANECEADLCKNTEVGTDEASSGAGRVATPEGLRVDDLVAWPTVGLGKEGVVAIHEAATVADVEGDEGFDPSHFWLLLERAGYETW